MSAREGLRLPPFLPAAMLVGAGGTSVLREFAAAVAARGWRVVYVPGEAAPTAARTT